MASSSSSCGFPIRSPADRHLQRLLWAVQTKRKVNLSREVNSVDLADLRRATELFRKVVPLFRVELDRLRARLLGVEAAAATAVDLHAQTNPFLEPETGAFERKKKVVTFAEDQQTNPFLTGEGLDVEVKSNSFTQPTDQLSGGGVTSLDLNQLEEEATWPKQNHFGTGATLPDQRLLQAGVTSPEQKQMEVTLPDQKLLDAGVTLLDRKLYGTGATLDDQKRNTSEFTKVPTAAYPQHSGASKEAFTEQAGASERKKKVSTFTENQQRPMVVQSAPEAKVSTACKTDSTGLTNKSGRTRRRRRSRPPRANPHTPTANQLAEKGVPEPLPPCYYCEGKHALIRCDAFRARGSCERLEFVQQMKLCINCFSQRHCVSDCRAEPRCMQCSGWHHMLLHRSL